jgi:hypothetical protein
MTIPNEVLAFARSLDDLMSGIPAINARLAQQAETADPVSALGFEALGNELEQFSKVYRNYLPRIMKHIGPLPDLHGKPEAVEVPEFLRSQEPELSPEIMDVLTEAGVSHLDSYERVNEALLPLFAQAKGCAEISRQPDCKGTFNGKTTIEWERKAQSINESIHWNSGRKVETI